MLNQSDLPSFQWTRERQRTGKINQENSRITEVKSGGGYYSRE
jgi:hypothetical protein